MKEEDEKRIKREKTNIDILKYHNNYIKNITNKMKEIKIIFDNRLYCEKINVGNLSERHDKFIINLINVLEKDYNYFNSKLQEENNLITEKPPECKSQ
jgi:mannose/fructose/N-acetylgalactosamine-specific phosphotransferase system component IIB